MIRKALEARKPERAFEGAELAGLMYAAQLTTAAAENITSATIRAPLAITPRPTPGEVQALFLVTEVRRISGFRHDGYHLVT